MCVCLLTCNGKNFLSFIRRVTYSRSIQSGRVSTCLTDPIYLGRKENLMLTFRNAPCSRASAHCGRLQSSASTSRPAALDRYTKAAAKHSSCPGTTSDARLSACCSRHPSAHHRHHPRRKRAQAGGQLRRPGLDCRRSAECHCDKDQ